jgi:hypothetical protein
MTFDALARARQRIAAQPPSPDGFEDVLFERLNAVTVAYASAVIAEPFIGCGHCTTPKYLEKIRVTPIMDLDDRTVFDIVSSLGLTYGQERDLAHFVPRFCVDGIDQASYDIAFAFSRMAAADFAHWPTRRLINTSSFLSTASRSMKMVHFTCGMTGATRRWIGS